MARKGRSAAGAAPSRPSSSHLHSDDEDVEGSVGGLQPQRDSDDEEEEQVFDLAGDYDDDSDDGSEDKNSSDDSDPDDESETEMDQLVKKLPPSMRQKILSGQSGADDGDDSLSEGSDSGESEEEGWGKKKKTYWTGDTADLEIGQDMEDAEDEEAAAMELEQARSSRLAETDYYGDMMVSGEGNGSEKTGSKKKKDTYKPDKLQKALELAAGAADTVSYKGGGGVEMESIPRDLGAMTRQQRLSLLAVDTPELPALAKELSERITELRQKINPVKELVSQLQSTGYVCPDEVVQYLEVKQQMLLSYCTNLTFYMLLKSQGRSVRSHPVMRQLLELRYAMEKLRPLDGKLKYQIDRLVKMAAGDEHGPESAQRDSLVSRSRPNPFNLSSRDGAEDLSADEEESLNQRASRSTGSDSGLYRPPRLQAAMYNDNEKQLDKTKDKLKTKRNKLKNSEIMESLREEFGVAPEMSSSAGTGTDTAGLRALQEEEDERRKFEEERFVRLTLSRKDKKDIRRRQTESVQALNNITDIGDIGEFDELNELSTKYQTKLTELDGPSTDRRGPNSVSRAHVSDLGTATALQRAVSAFASGSELSSKKRIIGDDVEDVYTDTSLKRKRVSKVQSSSDNGDDYGGASSGAIEGLDDDQENDAENYEGIDDTDFDRMLESGAKQSRRRRPVPEDDGGDDLLEEFSSRKKDFIQKKKGFYTAPSRVGGRDEVVPEGHKRGISYEIMANKGLTPHRKKANRNPRVKKREMYAKAVVARKGQVRDVISGAAGVYGGEKTGIKANVSRSRKLAT